MKIRQDFVTNSSSSSFVLVSKTERVQDIETAFQIVKFEIAKALTQIEELIDKLPAEKVEEAKKDRVYLCFDEDVYEEFYNKTGICKYSTDYLVYAYFHPECVDLVMGCDTYEEYKSRKGAIVIDTLKECPKDYDDYTDTYRYSENDEVYHWYADDYDDMYAAIGSCFVYIGDGMGGMTREILSIVLPNRFNLWNCSHMG